MSDPKIPTPRCPICKKPTEDAYRPFCSKRCADIDLGSWFKGDYAIPGDPVDPADLPPDTGSGAGQGGPGGGGEPSDTK